MARSTDAGTADARRACRPARAWNAARAVGGTAFWAALLLLLGATFLAVQPLAADERPQPVRERLEAARAQLDRIEQALERADPEPRALVALREQVVPLRDAVRSALREIEPRHAEAETRLKELGEPPEDDAPPEDGAIAAQRAEQAALLKELDGTMRQARLLVTRTDQIVARIDQQQRQAITERLFARVESILDPALWLRAGRALPAEARRFTARLVTWRDHAFARVGVEGIALALLASFAAVAAILSVRRAIRRRTNRVPDTAEGETIPPLRKALLALRDAALDSIAAPLAGYVALEILSTFGLLTDSIRTIGTALVIAIAFFAIGRALPYAVIAPDNPARRLVTIGDRAAKHLYRAISNGVGATAVFFALSTTYDELTVAPELTVATGAIYALVIAALIAHALFAHRETEAETGDVPPWIRLCGSIAAAAITVALLGGFMRFASFLGVRLVVAAVVLAALYLLLALVDALFGQGLSADSPRRRSVSATLGLRPRTLDLVATLFAGLLRGLLILTAIFLIAGTLTISALDLGGMVDRLAFGIEIGRTHILLTDVFAAVLIFLVGLVLTRIVHRWLSQVVLPRTEIEASLQISIATIIGYIGVIVATSVALGRLGLNLENVALVAGALSVGIGFGLQSVVSNFVSGLILLTERPIRVGDWIVAGNEQGYVRKISVRSTEIETFERATVILPNSDLITNVVKNWTHSNKLGRLGVPVGVDYSSDPDQVREILLAAAAEHPMILRVPEPYVLFMKFGDSALEFELRAVVSDVNQVLTVSSDLHFDIFRRFREAGIAIPFPQRNIHIRSAPTNGAGEKPDHVSAVDAR